MGSAVLYHEVVVVDTAEPLLVFAAFFLLGLVPAARADESGSTTVKGFFRSWLAEDTPPPKDERKDK
jgi:hypothetical protein